LAISEASAFSVGLELSQAAGVLWSQKKDLPQAMTNGRRRDHRASGWFREANLFNDTQEFVA
jgi:hypothetical protein